MATTTGKVKSTSHTKAGGSHTYGFILEYDNPSPPPDKLEKAFNSVDESFYRDAVSALSGGLNATVTDDGATPPNVTGMGLSK